MIEREIYGEETEPLNGMIIVQEKRNKLKKQIINIAYNLLCCYKPCK